MIDFVGKRYYFIAISLVLIIVSLISIFVKGFNLGVEFLGGSEIVVKVNNVNYTVADVRNALKGLGNEFETARIIEVNALGTEGEKSFSVVVSPKDEKGSLRVYKPEEKSEITAKIEEAFSSVGGKVTSFNEVSGDAAQEIKNLTWKAVVFTLLGILVYVALRFQFMFGIGAILALVHDVVITLGLFSIFGYEFNIAAVAAILTLVGYSVNDTIVVFDRLREFMKKFKGKSLDKLANEAINSTLSRTISTSLTTFFVIFTLFLLSGSSIKSFGFGMTVGIVVGTYSSIFIAIPTVIGKVKNK